MTVENTSNRDDMLHLAGVMSEGQTGYIEGMEAAGQAQLVHSDVLPAEAANDYNSEGGTDQWPLLEALGIVRGEPVAGDPLFVHATLPDGWTREASEHAMHSYLLDARGVRRVAIFYKAAFYDRRADLRVVNVGTELASEAIYGDDPAVLPPVWPKLTTAERADFCAGLESYRESALRSPSIYGDRLPRIDALSDAAHGTTA
ncbi:hypothetical protein FFI94_022110 [Rhodococcus sp. KBS0724]|uniref:hypothetical protein n=1 Tax=Rhodococcus sp. KBS0724 TaxID=1179674 RepID=UPI00110D8A07|nr:hypothetical protein [Rhodococcus sp. KBS0724]TSD48561.1 hypothetical protein FFI94_022110 [Rhodococcus sp. KBS0724]